MSFIIKCLDCGHNAPYFPTSTTCPKCGSQWREAEYDYELIGKTLPEKLKTRQHDLWRYHELLPVRNPNISLSLG
ncbi:MAG: threonine synthase, partial [Chloroflexi bacterium]|nr:threonine synthase [Chloroflexota bacterium]